jgi:hyaluronan synthase/N-acetylglucosaminyltransferase
MVTSVILGYAALGLALLGLQIIFAHAHHARIRRTPEPELARLKRESMSVIYPVYNESPEVLRLVLDRARQCLALPRLEIIVVDDGSPNRSQLRPIYREYECDRLRVLYQPNKGKREAQYTGLAVATGDYIVTVDSDTLIDPEGLLRLIAPLVKDERCGAVCGDVRVENARVNLLTRLIACRYWTAFNLERAAQSFFRSVLCCSGPLSAYRGSVLNRVKDAYIGQTFFGRRCTYGDDRHLTNLVLGEGLGVVYQPDAVGWTYVPETVGEYIKQQNRWNKSFYREILWTLRIADRVHPYALFDMLLQPVLFIGFTLALSYSVHLLGRTADLKVAVYYLTTLVAMASTRALYGLWRTLDPRFLVFVLYGFLHVFVLMPVRFKSVLTLTDNDWGTRGVVASNPYVNFSAWAAGYATVLLGAAAAVGLSSAGLAGRAAEWDVGYSGSIEEWAMRIVTSAGYSVALIVAMMTALIAWSRRKSRIGPWDLGEPSLSAAIQKVPANSPRRTDSTNGHGGGERRGLLLTPVTELEPSEDHGRSAVTCEVPGSIVEEPVGER